MRTYRIGLLPKNLNLDMAYAAGLATSRQRPVVDRDTTRLLINADQKGESSANAQL